MCLTTFDGQLHTAKEDIKVYKICRLTANPDEVLSTGQDFLYSRNIVQPQVNLVSFATQYYIGENTDGADEDGYVDALVVEEGYHSCPDLESTQSLNTGNNHTTEKICIFTIPKGAQFIKGWFNDDDSIPNLVSSSIVFNETLEQFEKREGDRKYYEATKPRSLNLWGAIRGIFR